MGTRRATYDTLAHTTQGTDETFCKHVEVRSKSSTQAQRELVRYTERMYFFKSVALASKGTARWKQPQPCQTDGASTYASDRSIMDSMERDVQAPHQWYRQSTVDQTEIAHHTCRLESRKLKTAVL